MKNVIKYLLAFMIGVAITFAILLFSVGPGPSDWEYVLPNGYELWKLNSNEIVINDMEDSTTEIGIPSFIKEFSYDERYVFTRNVESISNNNIFDEAYYVLDTEKDQVYGPFDGIEELKTQCENLRLELPQKWYRTYPDPNMQK